MSLLRGYTPDSTAESALEFLDPGLFPSLGSWFSASKKFISPLARLGVIAVVVGIGKGIEGVGDFLGCTCYVDIFVFAIWTYSGW